jgi:hypothetical protein
VRNPRHERWILLIAELLRDQIFATASAAPVLDCDDFMANNTCDAKSQKQPLASDTLCTLAAQKENTARFQMQRFGPACPTLARQVE